MNDDYKSALGKDTNNALYEQDRISRLANSTVTNTADNMNKMVANIRKEMLEGDEINFISTTVDNNVNDIITENDDVVTIVETAINTNVEETVSDSINTAVEKAEAVGEQATKSLDVFTAVSKTIGVSTKVAKVSNKIGGKLVRFGKNNLNIIDGEGNVDSIKASTNQVKTVGKFVGRNVVGKPAMYVGKKANNKIVQKPVQLAVKGIKKVEKKVVEKTAKTSIKVVNKLITVIVKVISQLIQAIVKLAVSCLPAFLIAVAAVLIIVLCLKVFGGGMEDEQLTTYSTYINSVQSSFQNQTQSYYNDGYKVEGTYNGVAYINWQAALSVMQTLQPSLDASNSEINLLKEMEADGVMYKITETTTSEYVLKEAVVDEEGNVIQEAVKTTKKYVVTVGTFDDYKNWVQENTTSIMNFYDAENVNYDTMTTNFLTDDFIEQCDTLYNSSEFSLLIDEAGITMGTDIADGTIFDTGEHSGVLAYPTTYRTISAGYPYYPSGDKHTGIDFPCPTGTPVCASADGEVIVVKNLNYSYGKYVVIKHNIEGTTLYTLYAHNSALKVSVGQTVKKGQIIAISGSTGNSTGPHCHLSVLTSWSPQTYVQPLNYL